MNTGKKNRFVGAASVFLAAMLLFCLSGAHAQSHEKRCGRVKNIIMMIPDGCNTTIQTVARWLKGEDLQVDKMYTGVVKTHMADSIITDSASAATAFSSGNKTSDGFLGVGPDPETLLSIHHPEDMAPPYAPFATLLEAAKTKGMSTGLVATSRITHATPAAFGSHVHDRGLDNEIMEHLVYNNIDVVFGGGKRHLLPGKACPNAVSGGRRTDCENLLDVLLDRGYQFVETRDQLLGLRTGRAWGLFNSSHMLPDIDRTLFAPDEPSLAEMTAKAIELLSHNKKGFFLLVEGSQVDWGNHGNDPIYAVRDFIAFDDAVKVSCEHADQRGQTLVLAFPDHNTGGMTIGHYYTPMSYTQTTVEDLIDPLKGMTMTAAAVAYMLGGDTSAENIISTVGTHWGLGINESDTEEIMGLAPFVGLDYALAYVVSKNHTVIGWTTFGHTGGTVPMWIHGMHPPRGVIDNTDITKIAADAMRVKLDWITKNLYVDLDTVTSEYQIDRTDPENLVLRVKGAELPISKDFMIHNGKVYKLPGVTIYAPMTKKVYVSKMALWRLQK